MESVIAIRGTRAWKEFHALIASDGPIELVEAALWVSAAEYPDLDVQREASRVRFLAGEAARRTLPFENPFARIDALQEFLYDELGFRGNSHRYKDPRNSHLNEVLNRRLGIPLTLGILYIELARASGFTARGVNLPGHFVVRLDDGDRRILVDPFHRGRVLSEEDCADLATRTTGRKGIFRRGVLDGCDERPILGRLLMNLKHIYVGREDYHRALGMVERLLLLWPGDNTELRDRGFLKAHVGRHGAAIQDLEDYLSKSSHPPDRESVQARVAWLRRHISQLN